MNSHEPASNPVQTESATIAQEPEISDLQWIEKCQHGDETAFGELVTKYRGKVYAMIYNMVRNEQDAWDIAQESFVKAWKSLAQFRGQSSFYTWLYRIVMNMTIDWLRKKKVTGAELDDSVALKNIDPASATTPRGELLPNERLGDLEIRVRIDDALEKLSADHRTVIVMKEIEGMQYHEIAETLNCSIGTVMSRLFYARKKMQNLLKDVYENL